MKIAVDGVIFVAPTGTEAFKWLKNQPSAGGHPVPRLAAALLALSCGAGMFVLIDLVRTPIPGPDLYPTAAQGAALVLLGGLWLATAARWIYDAVCRHVDSVRQLVVDAVNDIDARAIALPLGLPMSARHLSVVENS